MAGKKTGFTACIIISGINKEEKVMSTFFGESNRFTCRVGKAKLFNAWKTFDFSSQCVIGFTLNNLVYLKVCPHDYIEKAVGVSRESGEPDNFRVRFTPSVSWKHEHIAECAQLCSVPELEQFKTAVNAENLGSAFEIYLKKYLHCEDCTKDNEPFTEAADMTINGTTYSIKFENATLCNETYFAKRGFTTNDFESF